MKSDDMLLLALHGFVISVGFFISIYPGKESNVTENNENDVHSNISCKILLFVDYTNMMSFFRIRCRNSH
jgi:hypothetical protein